MVKLETTLVGLVVTTILLTGIAAGINAAAYNFGKFMGHREERKNNSKISYKNFDKESKES